MGWRKNILKKVKLGVDILNRVCYNIGKQEGNGLTSSKGGEQMTVLEIIGLLNLLAVVIFGVISITKK